MTIIAKIFWTAMVFFIPSTALAFFMPDKYHNVGVKCIIIMIISSMVSFFTGIAWIWQQ